MNVQFETQRPGDYLERLAASNLGRSYKARAVDELQAEEGHRVVDLGCGPGVDLAAFARLVGHDGEVIGVDRDAAALARASALVRGLGTVSVCVADVAALPLVSGSVDRVHTDRVLQHVDDPGAVLREVARVLRPGGQAVFAEPDWDALVIDHVDERLADTYRRFIVDAVIRNPRIGRQIARLARDVGLDVDHVTPETTVFLDAREADAVLGLERVTSRAAAAGYFTHGEACAWISHLREAPFLAAVTMLVTVVQRPA